MRIAILSFSASDNEKNETFLAVSRAGMQPEKFVWNEATDALEKCDGYILSGDFSTHMRTLAEGNLVRETLRAESHLGKPILGLGQGAKLLLETGLIPGVEHDKPCITLTDDMSADDNQAATHIHLSRHYQFNAFTRHLQPDTLLPIPVSHPKKCFVIPPALFAEMQLLGSTVFQYCDANGKNDPVNPIAAVSNKAGNVMAMLVHPITGQESDLIFQSMHDYIKEGYVQRVLPMNYYPRGNFTA
ncbi:MAG TPA: phosphoribosylformylglycinamidine synthase subunit PurQ [Gammaproteobacteria bacterium]|nr:phosphoribosylformylglycinamidine synthase subunit PurQ [Gammaproteobacteria bacterium]